MFELYDRKHSLTFFWAMVGGLFVPSFYFLQLLQNCSTLLGFEQNLFLHFVIFVLIKQELWGLNSQLGKSAWEQNFFFRNLNSTEKYCEALGCDEI